MTEPSPRHRPGRTPGGDYTARVRQVVADLLESGDAFGVQEVYDRNHWLTDTGRGAGPLPDPEVVARVLWRFARQGELEKVARGQGSGTRALYVKGGGQDEPK